MQPHRHGPEGGEERRQVLLTKACGASEQVGGAWSRLPGTHFAKSQPRRLNAPSAPLSAPQRPSTPLDAPSMPLQAPPIAIGKLDTNCPAQPDARLLLARLLSHAPANPPSPWVAC